jgi:ABC-type oligopeptide transport system substrate-binding subunit
MISRHLFLCMLLSACLLLGCGNRQATHPAETGESLLRRGLSGEPASLDPAFVADSFSFQVLQDLYEGLTTEAITGDPLPAAAASWTVDALGTTYTFTLRADAKWSNGEPLVARQFVDAWRRVVDPREASPIADDLRLIAGASDIIAGHAAPESLGVFALGDRELVVRLVKPAAFFPSILAHAAAFPIYSNAAARSRDPAAWISNGPYVLSRWSPGAAVTLERNTAYWDRAKVAIERVEYRFASDDAAQYAQYRAGQLDVADAVPTNAVAELRATRPAELVVAPYLATAYLGLSLAPQAPTSRVKFRQALSMAIDRRRLVLALGFGQQPAFGFVPAGVWHYAPQTVAWHALADDARIAAARRLFAEAQFPEGPVRLRLLYNANPGIKMLALLIAAMWKETLGIETELEAQEYRVFLQTRHERAGWDVIRLAWTADFNDASNFLDIFRRQSINNDEGYRSERFDALVDRAADTADPTRREGTLEEAERVMLDDYPVLPLYQLVSRRLVKPYVSGAHPTPLNRLPTKSLAIRAH